MLALCSCVVLLAVALSAGGCTSDYAVITPNNGEELASDLVFLLSDITTTAKFCGVTIDGTDMEIKEYKKINFEIKIVCSARLLVHAIIKGG